MRRWSGALAVVVGHAAIQAWLVSDDPVPAATAAFALLTIASAVAALVALVAVTLLVVSAARPAAVLVTATVSLVLAVAGALVSPLLAALVLVVAGAVLPAVALGPAPGRRLRRTGYGALAGWAVGAVVLLALSWIVGLETGLLITGPVGSGIAWVVDGLVACALLGAAGSLSERADPLARRPRSRARESGADHRATTADGHS